MIILCRTLRRRWPLPQLFLEFPEVDDREIVNDVLRTSVSFVHFVIALSHHLLFIPASFVVDFL